MVIEDRTDGARQGISLSKLEFIRDGFRPRILLAKGPDLASHVAEPFRPMLEAGLFSTWLSPHHRLTITESLACNELLAFEATTVPSVLRRVTMVAAIGSSKHSAPPLSLDIFDAGAGQILSSGSFEMEPMAGSYLLTADLSPAVTDKLGSLLYIRVAGGPGIEDWSVRFYEWRRPASLWLRFGHRGLFGILA